MRNSGNRMWTLLVASLLTLITVCGLVSPAQAAGDATRPDVFGCFIWGGGVAYARQPVALNYWNSTTGRWVKTRSGTTTSGGCVRFNDITPGRYYMIEAYKNFPLNCYYYDASSPWVLSQRGDSLYRLGTTYVVGPYVYC